MGIQVTKINWAGTNLPLVASGIEFAPTAKSSARYTAYARREVIVAAGAIAVCLILFYLKLKARPCHPCHTVSETPSTIRHWRL